MLSVMLCCSLLPFSTLPLLCTSCSPPHPSVHVVPHALLPTPALFHLARCPILLPVPLQLSSDKPRGSSHTRRTAVESRSMRDSLFMLSLVLCCLLLPSDHPV